MPETITLPGLGNILGNGTKGSWYAQNTGRYVSELFGQVSFMLTTRI